MTKEKNEETIEEPKKRSKVWQMFAGFALIVGLVVGLFNIDKRWAKSEELKSYAKSIDLRMLDTKAAKSLDEFNVKQTVQFKALKLNMDSQYLLLRSAWLTDKVSQTREKLIKDPENKLLQIEYKELLTEKQKVKDALDKTFK